MKLYTPASMLYAHNTQLIVRGILYTHAIHIDREQTIFVSFEGSEYNTHNMRIDTAI